MRRFTPIILAVVCSGMAAGSLGYAFGKQRAITAHAATAISSFDTIKKLRMGELAAATSVQEARCFASSAYVLSESGWRAEGFRKILLPSLLEYRHTYRTNQAEWTPMEQRLERLLAQHQ